MLIIIIYYNVAILQKYRNIPAMDFLRTFIIVAIFIQYYWYITM